MRDLKTTARILFEPTMPAIHARRSVSEKLEGRGAERACAGGLNPVDYFARSDSYSFFARLGDAIHTGPIGNNLRDLRILLH